MTDPYARVCCYGNYYWTCSGGCNGQMKYRKDCKAPAGWARCYECGGIGCPMIRQPDSNHWGYKSAFESATAALPMAPGSGSGSGAPSRPGPSSPSPASNVALGTAVPSSAPTEADRCIVYPRMKKCLKRGCEWTGSYCMRSPFPSFPSCKAVNKAFGDADERRGACPSSCKWNPRSNKCKETKKRNKCKTLTDEASCRRSWWCHVVTSQLGDFKRCCNPTHGCNGAY